MKNWLRDLGDIFLPDACTLCRVILDKSNPRLCCDFCWQALPRIEQPCRHCAQPVLDGDLCGQCLLRPLTRGIAVAPLSYESDAVNLVHQLKFSASLRAARTLSRALCERLVTVYLDQPLPDVIVPTPLSWRRHVQRGYNQCDRLSLELAAALDLPVQHLLRRRHGTVQHGQSRSARARQPRRSFQLAKVPIPAHVALVDDVITTGTTMGNMAHTLSRAGVRRVDLWAPCRATAIRL